MGKRYDDSSIEVKGAIGGIRLRPASVLGTNGLEGAQHTVIEIIGNAIDEKLSGFGDKLEVGLHEDGAISVRDYGRGVPLGWNEKAKEWNYKAIYMELYAGGKYESNQKVLHEIDEKDTWNNFKLTDYPYLISIGLNGMGAAASQITSKYFTVISYRDGKSYRMDFEKGYNVYDELKVEDTDEPNGTYIKWKPDDEVFDDTNITAKWLEKLCKSLSYIAEFNVVFSNKGNVKEFTKSTLAEVLQQEVNECSYTHNFTHVLDEKGDVCICDVESAIGPNGAGSEFFHNKVSVSGGAHSMGYNTAMSYFFSGVSQEYGVKIKEVDYSGKFSCIISTLSNKMSPRGQTKDSISDTFIFNAIYNTVYAQLKLEKEKGNPWLTKIIESTVQDAQNRIAVAEMSKSLRETEKVIKKHKVSSKFETCRSYENGDVEATEFFIVEGDSAGGQVKAARDAQFQCLMPIRGKSLNVYKASIEKLIANKEIQDIVAVLGCGIDLGIEGYQSFDINKLKVGKIVFASDADIDGSHIKMLLFLIFNKLFPELLYEGRVYCVDTPLYVINTISGDPVYCMDDAELAKAREENVGNIRSIDRFKGLGEVDKDVLWNTTLNPATRHLRQIKVDPNDMDLYDTLDVLFGKSTERRKRAILGSMLGTDYDETISDIESLSELIDSMDLDNREIEEVAL